MKIAVVDIETTGFRPQADAIVEIGIVLLDLENGNVEELYNELVCEPHLDELHSQAWIFKNSSLSFSDLPNNAPLEIEKLQEIFDKYPATAYNKKFDFNFLKSRGLKISELPCPMICATDICQIPGKNGYKWPKVQEAWDFFFGETDYIEEHRGADDAKHEAKIIYELYRRGHYIIPIEIQEQYSHKTIKETVYEKPFSGAESTPSPFLNSREESDE